MKRRVIIAVLGSVLLCGCGDGSVPNSPESTEMVVQAESEIATESDEIGVSAYDYNDFVKLGNYKDYTVEVQSSEVSDDDVEQALTDLQTAHPNYVNSEKESAEQGDYVNVEYTVSDAEREYENYGSFGDVEVHLGTGSYFDDFENGIVGMKVGEQKNISVKVPR